MLILLFISATFTLRVILHTYVLKDMMSEEFELPNTKKSLAMIFAKSESAALMAS